jgi:biotin transport system substrate-specific component
MTAPISPAAGALPVDGETVSRSYAVRAGLVVTAIGLLAASAWLSVPFYPVPLTMQTLAVLVVGGLLGPRLGVAAVAGYLGLGLTGAPIFHSGLAGPVVLLGPTGGYLLGFLPAALVMGYAAVWARGSSLRRLVLLGVGAILAETSIYLLGVPWLAFVYTGGDIVRAAEVGAVPYLLGDALKAAVAIAAVRLASTHRHSWESLSL